MAGAAGSTILNLDVSKGEPGSSPVRVYLEMHSPLTSRVHYPWEGDFRALEKGFTSSRGGSNPLSHTVTP